MKEHTTHFHDCGCKSAKYEEEIGELKKRLWEAENCIDSILEREARWTKLKMEKRVVPYQYAFLDAENYRDKYPKEKL